MEMRKPNNMRWIRKLLVLIALVPLQLLGQQHSQRNWLSTAFDEAFKTVQPFSDLKQWKSANKAAIVAAINVLPDTVKAKLIKKADEAIDYQWPSLPASLYLDYKLTGTRINYEKLSSERRRKLNNLVVGELLERKGRFIPKIVDGLWLLMEESTWVAPAHIVVQHEGTDLPGANTAYIDLSASRTAANVAMTYHLLQHQLDKYSKVVGARLVKELHARIFIPYLNNTNFFWMGFKGNSVNNWNAFNNTNCMQTALLTLQPGDTLSRLSKKIINSIDFFINQYPADGGCDEGPSYWDMAGGKLANLLQSLQSASKGKIHLTNKTLIHDMGTYTYKMHISGNKMVNFADALANYTQNPNQVLAYGILFNDERLQKYAAYLFSLSGNQVSSDDLLDFASTAVNFKTLTTTQAIAPYPLSSTLSSLQVWSARTKEGSDLGFFIAGKGGHNAESHNHNDIGNFIVYYQGKPILIDAGVGTYTAKTFSNKRYEIWNVQSQWHNTPTINGFGQINGRNFKAKNFGVRSTPSKDIWTVDIAPAYPHEAMVDVWSRTIELDRVKHQVILQEHYKIRQHIAKQELNFICAEQPIIKSGHIIWKNGVSMSFDPKLLTPKVEEKLMDDLRFQHIWGKSIYRLKLTELKANLEGSYKIKISSHE